MTVMLWNIDPQGRVPECDLTLAVFWTVHLAPVKFTISLYIPRVLVDVGDRLARPLEEY